MVICVPFIHSVHDEHMKKVKVNENRWNRKKQTNKRRGATKKWRDFAVYALETEKPRKNSYEKRSKLKTANNHKAILPIPRYNNRIYTTNI